MTRTMLLASATLLASSVATYGQSITLPPDADNERAEVVQQIGMVRAALDNHSPDVHGPNGEDRRGKIWGVLVPWGIHDLGFNGRKGPWRAGANENTVFSVSHPVLIEGKPLAAGRYGVHMLAGEGEWTIIFSKNSSSWGSFSYDQAEDALRVTVKPEKAPYREWLTYDFTDRRPDRATVALLWEELRVPFTITVPDPAGLYIDNMRLELRNAAGFRWQSWQAAAQYCLQQDRNLPEALTWAETAITLPGIGQTNFSTLSTKAQILEKLSRTSEAAAVMATALDFPDGVGLRDPPVRPAAADARQAEGGAGGLREEREAVRRHVARARRPRARLLGDGRLQDGLEARGARADAGSRRAEPQEPRRRGGAPQAGPGHERQPRRSSRLDGAT